MSIDAGTIHRAKTFSLGHVPAWLWLGIGVYALAFSPDGQLLAAGLSDQSVRLFTLK